MIIKTIYEAMDATKFDTEKECIEYEKTLTIRKQVRKFIDDHFYYGMTQSKFFEIIWENKDELIKILSGEIR